MVSGKTLEERFALDNFPRNVKTVAISLDEARQNNHQVRPLTSREEYKALDQDTAYAISAAVCGLRLRSGNRMVGRKIGFTNRNIWEEYAVDVPTWSYMYDSTVEEVRPNMAVDLSAFNNLEPRIEPEIVFGLLHPPTVDMDDRQLLSCIDWIAHGFEIVISLFPNWKFTAVDTTAASALHARLIIGPKQPLDHTLPPQKLMTQLETFEIDLYRNGRIEDVGIGSNVLGGPIKALRHLVGLLANQDRFPAIEAGEMITTGTLTRALPISCGDRWHTDLRGIDLPGMDVHFTL